MTPFETALAALGVDAVVGFDRAVALERGFSTKQASDWQRVHDAYFGPTRHRRLQRDALALARRGGFIMEQLIYIERQVSSASSATSAASATSASSATATADAYALRMKFLEHPRSAQGLRALAKELVQREEKPYVKRARFSKSRCGTRTFTVAGSQRHLADLEARLRQGIDPDRPAAEQMAENFMDLIFGEQPAVAAAAPQPVVLVPLDKHLTILAGEGDEVVLGLSDGTTITGAEYLTLHHGRELQVALFHPEEGAVNAYRGRRYANAKQRKLATLVSPVCPVPDCRHSAQHCQVHHIKAWKHGGETNINNLAMLCPYHNQINDDDQRVRKRRAGRIAMQRGRPVWISPRGYPVPNRYHPYSAMELLFGAASRAPY